MDEIWEFLENNSPKLVFKERAKTPGSAKENKNNRDGKGGTETGRVEKGKEREKIPLRLNIQNAMAQTIVKAVSNRTALTLKNSEKSPIMTRMYSKNTITPVHSCKKFSPVLLTVKSTKHALPVKSK